jgi:hypothetical protein
MGKVKAPHHRGTYHQQSAKLRAAGYANPLATCWRCGRTLEQIRQLKPRARWTAGHVNPGEIGGELRLECSPCNYSHGAALGNRKRGRYHPQPPPVTELTW